MYIKQDIKNVKTQGSIKYGNGYTTAYLFPVSMSDYQQEFTDLNTVCDTVKKTEPSGVHFKEVDATWTKDMNYDTNMMDKVLEVRIVSDGKLDDSCAKEMMQKLEDHMQEYMKGYPEWDRQAEGPKPFHAFVCYGKENDLEKSEDDFAAAVESIPTGDKGLER